MEEGKVYGEGSSVNQAREVLIEEDEEEFRSCCEDEDELEEREELVKVDREDEEKVEAKDGDEPQSDHEDELDEYSVKMYFKGVSVAQPGDSCAGFSGIGVVIKGAPNVAHIQVQKRLDFYVEEAVAEYLALMDGLLEAIQNKIKCVYAFTNSEALYDQVMHGEQLESALLTALRDRVLEHSNVLETFVLRYVPRSDLRRASWLAQVAIGVVSVPSKEEISIDSCSICCEEKPSSMTVAIKCSHKFCSHCMKKYVEGKLRSGQVPIRCPQPGCKYCISSSECKSFLPVTSYETFEEAFAVANVLKDKIYCPYANCSVLLDPHECSSSRASLSSQPGNSCVECPVCQRFICVDCGVPWHSSLSCEEYQNLQMEEGDAGDLTLHCLAQDRSWRRCQECQRMIELSHGCNHMTCWCGHEFCYSCGADYRDGQQMCECAFWDESYIGRVEEAPTQHFEQWSWDSFESLPMTMDAYSDQERSQLALIQRFLAGGFSLTDHNTCQSPEHCPDPYVDPMKELQQLPWLERFVSVISDNYYEEYMQASMA